MIQTVLIHDEVNADADEKVKKLRLGLKREQQINLRDIVDASEKLNDTTEKLIEYLTVLNGVLIICAPSLRKILSGKAEEEEVMEISISGKRTKIKGYRLHEKITQSPEIAKKILILRVPGVDTELPDDFPATQVINLPSEFNNCEDRSITNIFDYWAKHCILGRLIALKKRNIFISADSVEK